MEKTAVQCRQHSFSFYFYVFLLSIRKRITRKNSSSRWQTRRKQKAQYGKIFFCFIYLVSSFFSLLFLVFFFVCLFLLFLSLFVRAVSLCGPRHLSVATVSDDNQTLVVVRPCHRHLASFFSSHILSPTYHWWWSQFLFFFFFLLDVIPSPWITRDCYPWSTDAAAAAVVVFLSSPTTAA